MSAVAADGSIPAPVWWASPRGVATLIGLYLGAHFALRLALGPTLGLDDAEQALFAQTWSLGYRFRDPPLFTWLLLPIGEVMGVNVVALSVLRYLLLGATYLFMYLVARRWIADPRLAALAVVSFASIYVFAFYAHHDLTHTTALGALIAAAFYIFARLVERPTTANYLLLGLCCGLGVLAKWNFAVLALGLVVTCLLHRDFRGLVLDWRALLGAAVAALVVMPTAIWALRHGVTPGTVSADILVEGPARGFGETLVEGTLALAAAILAFPEPFLPLFLVVFGPAAWRGLHAPRDAAPDRPVTPELVWLLIGVTLLLHWLLVPLAGAVTFSERWMHPALMILPVALFMLVERGRPSGRAITVWLALMALLVAVAFGARVVRFARGADHCGKCREMVPFAELADGLDAAGFRRGTIVVPPDEFHIGGNLRIGFEDSRVIDPAYPPSVWPGPTGDGQCLAVWQAGRGGEGEMPEAIGGFLRAELDVADDARAARGEVKAPMYGSTSRFYTLRYVMWPEGAGRCR